MAPTRILAALLLAPLLLQAQDTPRIPAPAGPGVLPPPPLVLTGEQTAIIMKQLEQLEQVIGKSRTDLLGAALAKFKAALASKDALSLYLECYKLENFDRRDLKTTDFQAWKDANEARLKDKQFTDALMLQLEYLVLTIQAQDVAETKDMGPMVTALQSFIPRAIAAVQETVKHTASGALEQKGNLQGTQNRSGSRATPPGGGGGRTNGGGTQGPGQIQAPIPNPTIAVGGVIGGALRQPVRSCEFARAYLLDNHLTRRGWCYSPLDVADIYDMVILPYYLELKPEEIGAQWDARIAAEVALRKLTMSETEFAIFSKERQPELAWQKARYMRQNNINVVQALADMLKVVRDYPTHPRAAEWLAIIREEVVAAQPTPATAAGAPPPAAAAPSSGTP
jgi:hypothetical protein